MAKKIEFVDVSTAPAHTVEWDNKIIVAKNAGQWSNVQILPEGHDNIQRLKDDNEYLEAELEETLTALDEAEAKIQELQSRIRQMQLDALEKSIPGGASLEYNSDVKFTIVKGRDNDD